LWLEVDDGTASAYGQFATVLQWEPGVEGKARGRPLRDVLGGMASNASRSP